jgi:hypothetical protein
MRLRKSHRSHSHDKKKKPLRKSHRSHSHDKKDLQNLVWHDANGVAYADKDFEAV